MKRFFAILLAAVLLLSMLPAASVAAQYATVVGGWLRLRSAANFNASTITSYYTGTEVEILGSSGGWYRVRTPDGRTGYMYGQYLRLGASSGSESGNAYVISHNGYGVRLRTGPGTGYRVIRTCAPGTPVTILQRGSYWSKVDVNGTVGYMMTQFLSTAPGGSSSDDESVECYATIWSRNGYGVRLRRGPGKEYGSIGTYSVGTTVAVLEKGRVWDRIRVGSRVGWMMNEFLDYHRTNEVTSVTLNNYSPAVGTVLAVQAISPSRATVSYEWRVDGVTKGTASTYTVTSADVGKQIQLKVTGTGSYTGSAKSAKTDKVLSNTQISGLKLNTTSPVVGNKLSATIEPESATVLYAWIVGDSQVSNASTYVVRESDVGKKIKLIVTGNGNYSGTKSVTTAPVAGTGKLVSVDIANTAPAVGDTLEAVVKPDQATVKYAWYRGDKKIDSATGRTYKLVSADEGKKITVKVTGTKNYTGSEMSYTISTPVAPKRTVPAISTSSLPKGKVGELYGVTLQATGGGITWSIIKGALPEGLEFDTSGTINGTPKTAGVFEITFQAANSTGKASIKLSLVIEAAAPEKKPSLKVSPVNITVMEGYTPSAVPLTITNEGDAEATVSRVEAGAASFTVTEASGRIAAGSSDSATWKITPPASQAADTTLRTTVTAYYDDGATAVAEVTFTVSRTPLADPPVILTTTLENGKVGEAYGPVQLKAGQGEGTLSWTAGYLPEGLRLSSDGELSGTPKADGEYQFTVTVTDAASQSDSADYTIQIAKADPPTITTTSAGTAKVGETYELSLSASGTGTLTWSASGLPDGLSLNGSVISGTPTAAGDHQFTVTVTDPSGQSDSATFTLQIEAADPEPVIPDAEPPRITTSSAGTAIVGEYYSLTLSAEGTGSFSWSANGLPSGLDISGNVISGTPAYDGECQFTVTVVSDDSNLGENNSDSRTLTLVIEAAETPEPDPEPVAPEITSGSLPNATEDQSYGIQLKANAQNSIAWEMTGGDLPNGISFGSDGSLGGTPDAGTAGTYAFTVTVTDQVSFLTDAQTFKLTVEAAPVTLYTLTVNGSVYGEYEEGESVTVTAEEKENKKFTGWDASGVSVGNERSVSFSMPANDVSLDAMYEDIPVAQPLGETDWISWSEDGMSVEWGAVDGASGYRVQRYKAADDSWGSVREVSGTRYDFKNPCGAGDVFYVTALGDGSTTLDGDTVQSNPFQ